MSASERDFEAASLYRTFRHRNDEATALQMARGRDYASERLFTEAVERAEAELLSIGRVVAFQESLVGLGIGEDQARVDALDHAWGLLDEARSGAPPSSASTSSARTRLSETEEFDQYSDLDEFSDASMQKIIEWNPGWDPTGDGWRLDESGTARVWRRRSAGSSTTPAPAKGRSAFVGSPSGPRLVHYGEIREPPDEDGGNVKERLIESFRGLGLSESAARDAAEGR